MYQQSIKAHKMPALVRGVAALSRERSDQVGPSSLIGITFSDKTLRVFLWESNSLTQIQIVVGPQNWNPVVILPLLPDILLVTSDNKKHDGGWQKSLEMFCMSPASDTTFQFFHHSRTVVPLESDWLIMTGWLSRLSDWTLRYSRSTTRLDL